MKLFSLIVIPFLLGSSVAVAGEPAEADNAGIRFRCGDLSGSEICLRVLRPQCILRAKTVRTEDDAILLPSTEVLELTCPGLTKNVFSPADLAGHVRIEDESDALEYLRFFSSLWTVGFFEEQQMEVFLGEDEDCYSSCLPAVRWAALDLRSTAVEKERGHFIVTRNVVRPGPSALEVTAYRVVVELLPDGSMECLSEQRIPLTSEDEARLTFRRAL